MSSETALIQEIEELGIQLRVDGGKLKIRAPKGVVTPELLEELKKHKEELLHLERWEFRHLEIPNPEKPGKVDIWLVGERQDKHEIMICFVRTEEWREQKLIDRGRNYEGTEQNA